MDDKYSDYKIPRILHQTFSTEITDENLKKIVQNNLKGNPYLKYEFYDNQRCLDFFEKHATKDEYNTFLAINPKYGAARADFFRYIVMYYKGGVYLDIKSSIVKNLFDYFGKDDEFILDEPAIYGEDYRKIYPTYEQWLLISKPKHIYMKRIIARITRDILYPESLQMQIYASDNLYTSPSKQMVMRITGPDAMSVAIYDVYVSIGIFHTTINYDKIASLGGMVRNFYKKNKHYSFVKEPLVINNETSKFYDPKVPLTKLVTKMIFPIKNPGVISILTIMSILAVVCIVLSILLFQKNIRKKN